MSEAYYPRPGTKIAEACRAIAEKRGLPAGPLSEILDCPPNEVKTRLAIPLNNGYLRYERRDGMRFFCMNPNYQPDASPDPESEDHPKQRTVAAADIPSLAALRDHLLATGRLKPMLGAGENGSAVIHINVPADQAMAVLKALAATEVPA